ncbi:hypothetical protein BE20_04565 [Sorangium cellulosum]|nr:hypothetical protein BE20_04565 [Sorangium cellulosum]
MHVDHLGSIDALTDEDGDVIERRRWGERPPASFPSETTQGFTGQTDPIVSIPSFGQSWNPYSYVLNNPLYVDPGGFQQAPPEDGARSPPPPGAELGLEVHDLAPIGLDLRVVPSPKHEARPDTDANTVAAETGGAMPARPGMCPSR